MENSLWNKESYWDEKVLLWLNGLSTIPKPSHNTIVEFLVVWLLASEDFDRVFHLSGNIFFMGASKIQELVHLMGRAWFVFHGLASRLDTPLGDENFGNFSSASILFSMFYAHKEKFFGSGVIFLL